MRMIVAAKPGRKFMSRTEAAKFLGISPGHLRNLEQAGQGPPCLHIGPRVRRYPVDELEQYLQKCIVCPAGKDEDTDK